MGTSKVALKAQVFTEMGGNPDDVVNPTDTAAPVVNVELTNAQFETAFTLGLQWFTARKGYVKYQSFNVIDGQNDYQMPPEVAQVLDVIFEVPQDVAAFYSLGFFDLIPYGPQNIGSIGTGLTSYSGFAQLIQFNEQRKRVFSVTPEWWYEQQTQILHITNRKGALSNAMLVQAKLSKFDSAKLNDKDDYIFGKYVRAKCKEIIGRIRSKYDNLPAAGGSISLDGRELLAEAKEDIKECDLEIFWSQGPDAVITG